MSAEDLAIKLYLEHSDLFAASHARVKSREARRFVDFFPREHRPLEQYGSESRRVLVVSQLRRWFARRNRSEYVDLRVSVRRARTVRYAKLALYFTGKKRPKIVSITPPNKLSYDRRTGDDVVREFLFTRGFLRHPDRTVSYQRALV